MPKTHKSFRDMHDHVYANINDQAAPGAPDRLAMRSSGNPNVFKESAENTQNDGSSKRASGGRTVANKQLSKRGVKLHGDNPIVRADKPRRAGGRASKHHQAAPTGLGGGHLLIIGLPHEPMKGSARNKPNAAPGSPGFKHGGRTDGDDHAALKRKLEKSTEQVSAFKRI
jgi:hypothetical protein